MSGLKNLSHWKCIFNNIFKCFILLTGENYVYGVFYYVFLFFWKFLLYFCRIFLNQIVDIHKSFIYSNHMWACKHRWYFRYDFISMHQISGILVFAALLAIWFRRILFRFVKNQLLITQWNVLNVCDLWDWNTYISESSRRLLSPRLRPTATLFKEVLSWLLHWTLYSSLLHRGVIL